MNTVKRDSHVAGILYLIMAFMMIYSYMIIGPKLAATSDPVTTMQRIAASASLYRINIAISFASQLLFIFVALALYNLFRDVNRRQAQVMLVLVLMPITAEIVNIGLRTMPLSVLHQESAYPAAFSVLKAANGLGDLLVMFWGLWLLPFGYLTIKSRFFPRFLGYLLYASGVAYVVTCVTTLLAPDHIRAVMRMVTPFYYGEFIVVLWLAFIGARRPVARPADNAEQLQRAL